MPLSNPVQYQPTEGSYVGDSTQNRAIPHGLSTAPLMVLVTAIAARWYRVISSRVYYTDSNATNRSDAVTTIDATNFYVGDGSSPSNSANLNGITYLWMAIP